jgi:hypothetical protein
VLVDNVYRDAGRVGIRRRRDALPEERVSRSADPTPVDGAEDDALLSAVDDHTFGPERIQYLRCGIGPDQGLP